MQFGIMHMHTFDEHVDRCTWDGIGRWPGRWIVPTSTGTNWVFRLTFTTDQAVSSRIWISADRRYQLLIDGAQQAHGPEPGSCAGWRVDAVSLALQPGSHLVVVLVEHLGDKESYASDGAAPGLLCIGEGPLQPLMTTGVAPWECVAARGRSVVDCPQVGFHAFTAVGRLLDGSRMSWLHETGAGSGWETAGIGPHADTAASIDRHSNRALVPARLPPQRNRHLTGMRIVHVDASASTEPQWIGPPCTAHSGFEGEMLNWESFLSGGAPIVLTAGTCRRVIIDLGTYHCFHVLVSASGAGGSARLHASEALFLHVPGPWEKGYKGQRDEIDGKFFVGQGATLVLVNELRVYDPGCWLAGRFIELGLVAGDGGLQVESLQLVATGFPLERKDLIGVDEPRMAAAATIMWRTMEMCSHGTTMDCPFYERLQYAGDTRIQNLVALACAGENRLAYQAVEAFARSRTGGGLPSSRSPTRVLQSIPPLCWWWVAMLHDIAWWSSDGLAEAKRWLPDARATADILLAGIDSDGLLILPPGWGYTDWAVGWHMGMVPGLHRKPNAVAQFQAAHVLGLLAELESAAGEPALAGRWRMHASKLVAAGSRFRRGLLFADGLDGESYSEHANALAVLSGAVPPVEQEAFADALVATDGLHRATVYFTHYLFDALGRLGRADAIQDRLSFWLDLPDLGFTTTPEEPEPSRSDCHAWGAHPLWHLHTTFAGVRPTAPGFATIRIRPQLGRWSHLVCDLPVPQGVIRSRWNSVDGHLTGCVDLPSGIGGVLVLNGSECVLSPGSNRFGASQA